MNLFLSLSLISIQIYLHRIILDSSIPQTIFLVPVFKWCWPQVRWKPFLLSFPSNETKNEAQKRDERRRYRGERLISRDVLLPWITVAQWRAAKSVAKVEGRLWKTGVMPGLIDSPVHRLLQYRHAPWFLARACRAIVLYVLPRDLAGFASAYVPSVKAAFVTGIWL